MASNEDVVINNLLCFINSARNDYPRESLKDVTYAFYSHEEIKNAKITLCNLLKKDISWRRDPDKKRKGSWRRVGFSWRVDDREKWGQIS